MIAFVARTPVFATENGGVIKWKLSLKRLKFKKFILFKKSPHFMTPPFSVAKTGVLSTNATIKWNGSLYDLSALCIKV